MNGYARKRLNLEHARATPAPMMRSARGFNAYKQYGFVAPTEERRDPDMAWQPVSNDDTLERIRSGLANTMILAAAAYDMPLEQSAVKGLSYDRLKGDVAVIEAGTHDQQREALGDLGILVPANDEITLEEDAGALAMAFASLQGAVQMQQRDGAVAMPQGGLSDRLPSTRQSGRMVAARAVDVQSSLRSGPRLDGRRSARARMKAQHGALVPMLSAEPVTRRQIRSKRLIEFGLGS
ncbi:MAG: hypothetical protein KGI97_02170 [Alphaproteobacteria bacterium]|nr:hypothetical protein [Alphaproteobacteria bacterium]